MSDKQSILVPGSDLGTTSATPNTINVLNVLQGLDRSEVEPLAAKILETIGTFCVHVEVAGSFRRGKQIINDLDVVVQPTAAFGFSSWLKIIKAMRETFFAVTEKQGDKLATLYLPFASPKQGKGHVQVDFYNAEASTWGVLLLVRTGSKEHNVKLCNLAISKGLRLKCSLGLAQRVWSCGCGSK